MARSASVIEINGNRYDAVTGQVIGAAKRVAAQVKNPTTGVIDGMVKRPALSIVSSVRADKTKGATDKTNLRQRYKTSAAGRQTQKSQTLMRSAVKKPAAMFKKETNLIQKSNIKLDPVRTSRAKTIGKNAKVEHFGKLNSRVSVLRGGQKLAQVVRSQPANIQSSTTQAIAAPLPSMITSASHQHLERLLDHALIQADAHKEALRGRASGWRRLFFAPRWITFGASSLALLLLVGFFAWQNVPQISMRVADMRAHVTATVPAYTPVGYKVAGPVESNDSQVTIDYKADTQNGGGYAITQQASNWDSSSVADNVVPAGTQVQSSQVNGTIVYIYGSNNDAAWVNHGVLFNLQDKAGLNSDQILKIASGL